MPGSVVHDSQINLILFKAERRGAQTVQIVQQAMTTLKSS